MNVRINSIRWTVAEYCQAFDRGDVLVDRRYQRNADVWPVRAQSYLIETVLRGFPMPKFALHQQTDIKNRKSIKYVVDGQQRTHALVDFFNGDLTLSRTLELEAARGKTFYDLSPELQEAFLSYTLDFDQFEAVDEVIVREFFRRINSFTAPLNNEERRNASFQGNMKWFILRIADRHTETLLSLETLNERNVVRMADRKLFAEIMHAMLDGVRTTNSRMLDSMYRKYDITDIPHESRTMDAIDSAFDRIVGWRELRLTALVQRSHIFYSLLLAIVAVESQWDELQETIGDSFGEPIHRNAERNLLAMAEALDSETAPNHYFAGFLRASSEKTNTWDHRQKRIESLAEALTKRKL